MDCPLLFLFMNKMIITKDIESHLVIQSFGQIHGNTFVLLWFVGTSMGDSPTLCVGKE